jgi:SpoVK/Ycf46/Vps4 family AAA+-type ATPase
MRKMIGIDADTAAAPEPARLDTLARRLEPKVNWSRLVVPEAVSQNLKQVVGQVKNRDTVFEEWGFSELTERGLGTTVLFTGASGTGKTLAAEVLAGELQLPLYRVDLSAVVSKYIGETEKNLRLLFDAAEDGGAILFFDEADALFGKRSKVKDSHDHHANIAISYLLQRIESYRGLVILETSRKKDLDDAFLRRLRFIVEFPFPQKVERAEIWRRIFPAAAPVDELDYESLAGFELSGGSIRNTALNAAFMAAEDGQGRITMPLITEAVRAELDKLDRLTAEAELV